MAENIQYDPEVIKTFANGLYTEANAIIYRYTLLGAILGGVGGYISGDFQTKTIFAIGAGIIVGFIGFAVGKAKAFSLKLQAQTALCQVQIEQNIKK